MFQPPPEARCICDAKGPRPVLLDLGDGTAAGLSGLQEVFVHFHSRGQNPSSELGEELLAAIKVHNYVPDVAAEKYRVALLREYAAYCAAHS